MLASRWPARQQRRSSQSPSRSPWRRQGRAQDLGAHRPGRRWAPPSRRRRGGGSPVGEAQREAESAADPAAEGRHREVALAAADFDQRRQARRRSPGSPSQAAPGAAAPRARGASAAAVTLAPLPCGRPRLTTSAPPAIAASAVPSSEASSATRIRAAGKAPRSARTVAPIRSASLRAATIAASPSSPAACSGPIVGLLFPPMADIEAHITGNVWKIEVEDGDGVSAQRQPRRSPRVGGGGNAVKGPRTTASSRKCTARRSHEVSEGDVLVVLE